MRFYHKIWTVGNLGKDLFFFMKKNSSLLYIKIVLLRKDYSLFFISIF